jgi:CheY-like chemotaxis protein
MSKEVLERALEPFFSTKSAIRGSGLGLSIVHSTVAAHKGQLELASEEGLGTRVVLRLPVCEPMNGLGVATPPALRSVVTSSHRVLLVDDDELVRNSIEAMLEGMGHSVSMAICGEEALSQLEDGFDPELVILDMNMPGLGGAKTLPRLRELRPRVPVLIATGRADQSVMDLMAAHAKVGLMCKPFGLEELRKHLENVGLG